MPDGHQFLLFQGRIALVGFLHEALESGIVVTVLFDDATGKAGHGSITAAFVNNLCAAVCTLGHICIKIICGQILAQGHFTRVKFDLWVRRSEKETGSIQSLCIEIRENGIDQFLHFAVCGGVRHILNGKQDMELGTSGFAVFLSHMKAAVVNGKGNAGKSRLNISRSDPIGRVLGVVIVTVHRQTVRAEEVLAVSIVIHVLSTDIVLFDRIRKRGGVCDLERMRIGAVAGRA